MEEMYPTGTGNEENPVSVGTATTEESVVVRFIKEKKILLLCVAAAIVLATVAGIILSGLQPERIAEKCTEAAMFGDHVKVNKYMAYDFFAYLLDGQDEEEFFENKSDYYHEDIKNWKDLSALSREAEDLDWKQDFDLNYKMTFEATRCKDISMATLAEDYFYLFRELETKGLLDFDDIKDAKIVTVKINVTGEDDIQRDYVDMVMVKIGLSWKALSVEEFY